MKSIKHNILKATFGLGLLGMMSSCNDSFLECFPETDITEKVFFKTVGDLESYTNGLYGNLGSLFDYWDTGTDNTVCKDDQGIYKKMRGEVMPETSGTWGWGGVRDVNFMLARVNNVTGDQAEIKHYVGLARMFRAIQYYGKVKSYSDVPWYSKDLQTTDTELLYKPQDPRTLVVDSVMADLDYAVKNMKEGASKTRVMKQAALALQARIALHEGTFRKYHKELGLTDGDKFLKIAEDAAKQLMDMGTYSLSEESFDGLEPYESLFCNLNLTSNPEMILCADYDKGLGRLHNSHQTGDYYHGISKSLMEDYLVIKDGKAVPFQQVEGYATKTYKEIFENRDPRLKNTIMWPGYKKASENEAHRINLLAGGYPQSKFIPRSYDQISWANCYTDLPIFRYAEILLIYAEAKAEMGTLTQEDVDNTINLIRKRVNMPAASLADWLANIDPVQAAHYPNVESSQKGAVLEIRRERRVETACEGLRYDDLMRWSCGQLFAELPMGQYIPGYGAYDTTGDGVEDVAVVATKADGEKYAGGKITVYVMEGNTIGLTEGDHGYIYLVAQKDRFKFEEPKYYYNPIAQDDMTLNENLYQNPFWK